jgi:hypothetical protein
MIGRSMRLLAIVCASAGCSLATSWTDLPLGERIDASVSDAALDANPQRDAATVDGGTCVNGKLYCGGDVVVGNPSTLYRCGANGTASAALICQKGCARKQTAHDDACVCAVDGLYCGNDQVIGDPGKLYKCNADYTATLVQSCTTQCVVRPGQNDVCN